MTNKYGTIFNESEAILAASEYDFDTLYAILHRMTQVERRKLRSAAEVIKDRISMLGDIR